MSPPVAVGNVLDGSRGHSWPVAIHEHAHPPSARERRDARTALEIVPLVLVEGSEKFWRAEAPYFTPHATTSGDDAGERAEVKQGARDVALVDERRPSREMMVRRLAAHQRAVHEDDRQSLSAGAGPPPTDCA